MNNTKFPIRLLGTILALMMCIAVVFTLPACDTPQANTPETTSEAEVTTYADEFDTVWADALYTEDTTIGEGAHSFQFEVVVGDNSVTFTVNTDEDIVGTALIKDEIITGDQGEFGLYVKTVNGILADYDVNSAYWAFYQNGEYALTGVDQTEIEDGAHYEMVYTK